MAGIHDKYECIALYLHHAVNGKRCQKTKTHVFTLSVQTWYSQVPENTMAILTRFIKLTARLLLLSAKDDWKISLKFLISYSSSRHPIAVNLKLPNALV